MIRSPETYIDAQEAIFKKFQTRSIPIKHWSKFLMTPAEMRAFYKLLDKYKTSLREIASNDIGESGDIARKTLGL